jgi:di/tricarboxylate transporter
MTVEAALTLVVLAATVLLLITEWVPPGMTGLLAIVALILCDVLPADVAFSGLTNAAVITVASMYVISAAVVRTGATAAIAERLTGHGHAGPGRAYLLLLVATMMLSGFVNNTPLILIFLPLVLGLASRMGQPPSKLLIPLSYVSILGGSVTLIGTSTNLIVASSLRDASGGALELGMFDFAPLGIVLVLAGGALVIALRRRLLPDRPSLDLQTQKGVAVEYVTEVTVLPDGGLAGRTLAELEAGSVLGSGTRILQVVRGEVIRIPRPEVRLEPGDLLLVKGQPEVVLELRLAESRRAAGNNRSDSVRGVGLTLFELVVTPGSRWVTRRVGDLRLHDDYDVSVFAVQRHGAHLREKIDRLALQPGDVLLLQGSEDSMRRLREASGVLVVEGVDSIARDTGRAPLAALAVGAFVVLAMTGMVAIEVAALCAALFTVLTGCVSVRRAYESIGWDVLFVIAGTLALGIAFVETGIAATAAHGVVEIVSPYGTRAVLAVVLVFTALMTQVVSNNATAAVMTPIAFQLGQELDAVGPLPFVMAVAFGANCSFLTPVSYNTNLIVYGPGAYRFTDFLRLGLPLTILFLGIAIVLLPVLY